MVLFSVAFVPLFANMIAVLGKAAHSFQFAGLLALFRSSEPFAYISYTGALLAASLPAGIVRP